MPAYYDKGKGRKTGVIYFVRQNDVSFHKESDVFRIACCVGFFICHLWLTGKYFLVIFYGDVRKVSRFTSYENHRGVDCYVMAFFYSLDFVLSS